MSNNFNERIFDEIMSQIFKKLRKERKTTNITTTDFENTVNDILNDDAIVKKYKRNKIIKYTTLLKDEINKKQFGLRYLKGRVKKIKEHNKIKAFVNKKNQKRASSKKFNVNFFIKNISSSILSLSKDMVLFFFTICIVAHLRIRSFIKSCYLYPSNPNRFPYVFYNTEKKEQNHVLSITNPRDDSDVDPVFENIRMFYNRDDSPAKEKNSKMNNMCGSKDEKENKDYDMLEAASKILFGDEVNGEQPYKNIIEQIVQELSGTTHSEKLKKMDGSSKAFMEEHREKCRDELSLYSLVTYLMYLNTFKNREMIAYLHNNLFKYLTSTGSKLKFGVIVILFYSIFKNNISIAERVVNNVLDYYSDRYDGGGKLHSFFSAILSSVLAPFVTFALLLLLILYPLSIFNCMKGYFNYVNLTNQISTKIICYIGIIYSIFALFIYSFGLMMAIFPEFLRYMRDELRFMMGKGKKNDKSSSSEKETKGTYDNKGKGAYGKKGKGAKGKKGKSKEGFIGLERFIGLEGFANEKGCSPKGFNFAKLFGILLSYIFSSILIFPVVMPFVCAFATSFGIASSLSFDALKFMSYNMCSIKEYSSIIKVLVSLILIHQIFNRYSYGANRSKWLVIGVYILALLIYSGIEQFAKPTDRYFEELKCDN